MNINVRIANITNFAYVNANIEQLKLDTKELLFFTATPVDSKQQV
jgi:hypothetical protein